MKSCPLLFLLFNLSISKLCLSQETFFSTQEKIFALSEKQWLCQQLQEVNPGHFLCNKNKMNWSVPTSDSCLLFGKSFYISPTEREKFNDIIFPGGNCRRYLTLISLCDLYFPLFRKDCIALGLPDDFKILPLLLSGCNQSFENDKGQAGLWAMDYLVARKFHLRVDTLVDERRGGDFSSRAAVKYIDELYDKCSSDPVLTIAGYLLGVPAIQDIYPINNKAEYFDKLDANTHSFLLFFAHMSQLIASTRMDNQLNNYFDIMANYEAIPIEREVKIEALIEILGNDKSFLAQYNPVYIGSVIEPGYRKVPFMLDRVSALKFEALKDSIYFWTPPIPIISKEIETVDEIILYKVKRGDSLGKIAEKFSVSVKQIKQWNNLKSDKISKGKKLKIIRKFHSPVTKNIPNQPESQSKNAIDTLRTGEKTDVVLTDNSEIIKKIEMEASAYMKKKDYQRAIRKYEEILLITNQKEHYEVKLADAKNKLSATKKAKDTKLTYTVRNGDSLWKISKKYPGVTEKDIMKWNNCSENIRPGQKLIIRTK